MWIVKLTFSVFELLKKLLPDDFKGSQDTVMLGTEDLEEDSPVVDVESIQRVVSFSQSFCDVRPDIPKGECVDNVLQLIYI